MKTIAIVAGGYSSEYVVSLKSAQGIYSFLDKSRYQVYIVLLTRDKWVVKLDETTEIPIDRNDFGFVKDGQKIRFDYAYITIHGTPGENGLLQGYLDMIRVPYSCCGVLAAALTFHKYQCNRYLQNFGIRVSPSLLIRKGDAIEPEKIVAELGLPVFVKPNDGGSSFATTKVKTLEQLEPAIRAAWQEGEDAIVERFMPGTEITCGCFRANGQKTTLPVTEVVNKNEFFDYEAKYTPGATEEITPARLSEAMTREVQETTARIYDLVGAKGIVRVDYIIQRNDGLYLLEVNTTPGMTATSFIPQQVGAAGLNMTDVLTSIIEYGQK